MPERELYVYRARCGSCNDILWSDRPMRTNCLCPASWVEADGTLGGNAVNDVTDTDMIEYIRIDQNRDIEPWQL